MSYWLRISDGSLDVFFVKQKTAYEVRISDWSSDVCSSDLIALGQRLAVQQHAPDIRVRRGQIIRVHREMLAARQVEHRALHERPPDHILVDPRRHRIKSEPRKEHPRRHLPEIVIARQSVGGRLVLDFADLLERPLVETRETG